MFPTPGVKAFVVGGRGNVIVLLEEEGNFVKKVYIKYLKTIIVKDLIYCTHNSPCLNGGICQNNVERNYTCKCAPGFSGRSCEKRLTNCKQEPCYMCPEGWTGTDCGYKDICLNKPCLNGGTCINVLDSFQCYCTEKWEGKLCQNEARKKRNFRENRR